MINKAYIILGFLFLGLVAKLEAQQKSLQIFVDFERGDSMEAAKNTLTKELAKAGFTAITVLPAKNFNENGIFISVTNRSAMARKLAPPLLSEKGPEGVYVRGSNNYIVILGNTALAIQEAVFIYLEQLGYRYFLPGNTWTVIPALKSVFKPINILTAPDYEYRTISLGYGFNNDPTTYKEFYDWYSANRLGGAFNVGLGHMYDLVVQSNKEAFKQHPEWFAGNVAKGEIPVNPKFNIANKSLVEFVENYVLSVAKRNMESGNKNLMLSMDPSDAGGFCEKPECLKIGGPSEQAFFLANIVAKKVREKYPWLWVGMGAYSEYISPPALKIEPNIFVLLTTAFNPSGFSTVELIKKWKQKVSKVGIYEYLSFYDWDFDVPGRSHVSDIPFLQKSIKNWYNNGVRSYEGESTIGYISRGLGHYITAKLLWNVNVNVDSLTNDFFVKAFEDAASPMRELHKSWQSYSFSVPPETDLLNWMNLLQKADNLAKNNIVKSRIRDYKAYIHYLVLYSELSKTNSREKMLEILNYAWRSYYRPSFSTIPVMQGLPLYFNMQELRLWETNKQSWKTGTQNISDSEIECLFERDKVALKGLPTYKVFSQPNKFKTLNEIETSRDKQYETSLHTFLNRTEFLIQVKSKTSKNKLMIESGYTATPSGIVSISITAYDKKDTTALLTFSQSQRAKTDSFSLATLPLGFYTVTIDDPNKAFKMEFLGDINYSVLASPASSITTNTVWGYNTFYFYVPPGVQHFEIYKSGAFSLQSPNSRVLDYSKTTNETLIIDVLNNESGLWKITGQFGKLSLRGVPGLLATDPRRMLIPDFK